ncbi:hypothetical protein VT84_13815 [Gemmata sp. SH-PL17]|uniref:hypothetical protein n=1 Tax=Gemmata sp. SH-PL17 TaxID=1630693 RepID=UPI00078EB3CC|nr:hypothetical protein [Gemmata sp. SH-PL17]AMV25470.1 hypothetical protein VT84_13815 [Gemmata sp. SH-PL17]
MSRKHKLRRTDIKWREDPVTHEVTAELHDDHFRARQRGIAVIENWLATIPSTLNRDQLVIEVIMMLEGKVAHTSVIPVKEDAA